MRQLNKITLVLLLIWIAFAIVFAIYDLQISIIIVDKNSVWAKFLDEYGMIPGLIVILTGILINYSNISRNTNVWSYFKRAVFFLTISGLLLYLADIILSNIVNETLIDEHFIICFIISLFISLLILISLQITKPVQDRLLVAYSKTVLGVAFFGYVICIQVVKTLWGRVRFKELDAAFSQFTPWYLPRGITGYDSFPSGHAAMGWMLLALLILFADKKPWLKYSIIITIFLWGVTLALSRIVIGAHYASDVLFGSFFIIMIFLLLLKKYKEELVDQR